jgi:hypothetical protein
MALRQARDSTINDVFTPSTIPVERAQPRERLGAEFLVDSIICWRFGRDPQGDIRKAYFSRSL